MNPGNAADVGRFVGWAARPREVPGRHEDYYRLVGRYRNDPDFAADVNDFFNGAGMYLTVDERDGIIATAQADSPLRVTTADLMKRAQPHHRAVIGAVLLAVARVAYPETVMLDDPDRVAVFTTQAVVDVLDRAAQRHADSSREDASIDENDVEAWRRWSELAAARANAQRRSTGDRQGAVNRVCKFLADSGYLTSRGEVDGGTWLARPRFRHVVSDLAEDSELYARINGLLDADGSEPGERP
ncbi:hypothetical protein [Cryptosporangium sp. NPDC051539]|uniref:hypothetical protein n=1 Tax=Cryptosporangium sp. NPDC051539 TaxID=3363962 RepID=UPI0037B979C1